MSIGSEKYNLFIPSSHRVCFYVLYFIAESVGFLKTKSEAWKVHYKKGYV